MATTQDSTLAAAEAQLQRIYSRLAETEMRQKVLVLEQEALQTETAQAELAAALNENARPSPKVATMHERLKTLADESAALARIEMVLRKAGSEQHKTLLALRIEAAKPQVTAALARWDSLLATLVAFGDQATIIGQAFARACVALDRQINREDAGWFPSPAEFSRLQERTERIRQVLRAGGFDV